jgi:L-iditol 2-dehydrogenase
MKQAVMTNPGKIEFRDIQKPAPAEDEVLIKIERIGVCGSDIHVFHGLHPYTSYPVVQGHELGGVVAEPGKDVEGPAATACTTFVIN